MWESVVLLVLLIGMNVYDEPVQGEQYESR